MSDKTLRFNKQSRPNKIGIPRQIHRPKLSQIVKSADDSTESQVKIYYVSLYTQNRKCLFGKISDDNVNLNQAGLIVQEYWYDLPIIYPCIQLDLFVVMPNHLHGLLMLSKPALSTVNPDLLVAEESLRYSYSGLSEIIKDEIIKKYMSVSSRLITELDSSLKEPIWRKNFETEDVRNEFRLNLLRDYIADNPSQWEQDPMNPVFHKNTGFFPITNKYTDE